MKLTPIQLEVLRIYRLAHPRLAAPKLHSVIRSLVRKKLLDRKVMYLNGRKRPLFTLTSEGFWVLLALTEHEAGIERTYNQRMKHKRRDRRRKGNDEG